jgi:lipopolysaccharide/colanic/teichoic acid biosynthesis glycosyltransferase
LAKRLFDVVLSIIGLIVLSPVIVIVAFAVVFRMGWPIFYRADRAGRNGKSFKMVKFRSMRQSGSEAVSHHSGDDDPRITGVGRFLRRFKLDEIPQLVNVIIGNMSLVGPRPETLEYIIRYTEEEMEILSVRPGITDFASIEFADLGSILAGGDPDKAYFEKVWGPKMELRMRYVRERSFWVDLKIISRTLAAMVPSRNSGQ